MPPKSRRTLVAAVLIVVVVVTVLVLAAFLFVAGPFARPTVSFESPGGSGACTATVCAASVEEVSVGKPIGEYQVAVEEDGARVVNPAALVANAPIEGQGLTLRYADNQSDGLLNAGDGFTLEGGLGGHTYRVVLLHGGGEVGAVSFAVPLQAPVVTLGPAEFSGTAGEATVDVAGVDLRHPLARFKVQLQNRTSTPTDLCIPERTVSDGVNLCGGAVGALQIDFEDLAADGLLNAGDYFTLRNLADGTSYRIVLLWGLTGDQIGQRDVNY